VAYGGGYEFGYQDGSGGWVFTPDATGYSISINGINWEKEGYRLWNSYGSAIPVQKTLVYTSGASSLTAVPSQAVLDAADAGSGNGDKMVYPTPTSINISITEAEALAIVADETYADYVSQVA